MTSIDYNEIGNGEAKEYRPYVWIGEPHDAHVEDWRVMRFGQIPSAMMPTILPPPAATSHRYLNVCRGFRSRRSNVGAVLVRLFFPEVRMTSIITKIKAMPDEFPRAHFCDCTIYEFKSLATSFERLLAAAKAYLDLAPSAIEMTDNRLDKAEKGLFDAVEACEKE